MRELREWKSVFGMLLAIFSTALPFQSASAQALDTSAPRYAIVIHGGAIGSLRQLTAAEREAQEASLRAVLEHGRKLLAANGSSLDAVEQVLRLLEDDPLFNAGRGAVLNEAGQPELDASIMDGRDLSCGAVAGVRTVKNPISLARLVMTKTRHVLLIADGAEQFADQMAVERATIEYFRTPERLREWQERRDQAQRRAPKGGAPGGDHMGTVGCVALDAQGNLAAGTSTGGLTYKRVGRVGDSPIVGAGTYASNATCAVSCTGTGEEFIRRAAAFDVSALMAYRELPLEQAVRTVVHDKLPAGSGAMIAVSHDGQMTMQYNTEGLARAAADSSGRFEVVVGK